ncbi:PREDICTED: utrophin-like isoform X2 [Amphimedon queenslandica]|uniref:ZZ-type domain-containing protein n=1 Tax=Amphimedon queenslandica TaxID=400682 RepID=A0AAN0IZL0_AMPQE|nr:PREDICTED: utrophin-like isoform X2 [Amphimedon queenslandica]|eukprot:XP_019850204.1 PREDICTED: utrophin-like isoform X2 [Amphimedon queenslandica]
MNTLLGELATYNDIRFPRYRLCFKLRRLQTCFLLHRLELSNLQDIFHSTGLQPLPVDNEVTESQLSLIMEEIYAALKNNLPKYNPSSLQEAHTTCFNWFMMALQCGTPDSRGTVGVLKIILCLFCGGKISDKAKYMFGILARNGTVGLDGLQFFCESMQLLANFLQEILYPDVTSVDRAMSECLFYVRNQDDIQDEEEDGGLQRPWLSLLELVKAFTASPPLNFLSWLHLWTTLPSIEKVIHQVKCSICSKKTIKGYRYQCEECSNYNMCQICFLKGRTSDGHKLEHRVYECQDYNKSFKSRMGFSSSVNSKVFRIMDEPAETSTKLRLRSKDLIDYSSSSSLNRRSASLLESPMHGRSPSVTPEPVHRPTVIRIGSKDSLSSPRRDHQTNSTRRLSYESTSSSEGDGHGLEGASSPVIDGGLRKPSPIIPSIRRATHAGGFATLPHRSLQRIADEELGTSHGRRSLDINTHTFPRSGLGMAKTCSAGHILDKREQDEFNMINKKLSLEVDQLLQDIEPDLRDGATKMSFSSDGGSTRDSITILNELGLEDYDTDSNRIDEATQKKQHLSMELDSLLGRVNRLHSGFMGLKDGNRVSPLLQHSVINTDGHQRTGSLDLKVVVTPPTKDGYLSTGADNSGQRLSVVW